jgi:hypothetical protein
MPLDYAKTAPGKNSSSPLPIEENAAPIAPVADLPLRVPPFMARFYAVGLSTRRHPYSRRPRRTYT